LEILLNLNEVQSVNKRVDNRKPTNGYVSGTVEENGIEYMRFVEDASEECQNRSQDVEENENLKRDVETMESHEGRDRKLVENKRARVCAER
jgi:hypothetical protein